MSWQRDGTRRSAPFVIVRPDPATPGAGAPEMKTSTPSIVPDFPIALTVKPPPQANRPHAAQMRAVPVEPARSSALRVSHARSGAGLLG